MKSMEGSTAANLNTNSNWLVYILKDSSNDKTASIVYFVELSGTKFAVGPDSDGNYLITNNYSDLEDLGPGNTKLGEVIIP